ncbi:hypothetical protein FQZ97_935260 [compost metagenome]
MHRCDHLHRIPRYLRKRRRAVAPFPESGRGRTDGGADGGHSQGAQEPLRGTPQRQVRPGGAAGGCRVERQIHQRPPPARQGDRRDRRSGRGAAHPAGVQTQEDHQQGRGRRDRGQDRSHPAGQRVQRRPRQVADAGARPQERGVRPGQSPGSAGLQRQDGALWPGQERQADRCFPVQRPHRRRQDRSGQAAGLHHGHRPDPLRHVGIHGAPCRESPDRCSSGLCGF